MAAVKNVGRGYTDMDNAGQQQRPLRVWERTPRWHPRRWFGYAWRQRHYEWGGDGSWFYQTSKQRALDVLADTCAPDSGRIDNLTNLTATHINQRYQSSFGMRRPRS